MIAQQCQRGCAGRGGPRLAVPQRAQVGAEPREAGREGRVVDSTYSPLMVYSKQVKLSNLLLILVLLCLFHLTCPFILEFGLVNPGARANVHLLLTVNHTNAAISTSELTSLPTMMCVCLQCLRTSRARKFLRRTTGTPWGPTAKPRQSQYQQPLQPQRPSMR